LVASLTQVGLLAHLPQNPLWRCAQLIWALSPINLELYYFCVVKLSDRESSIQEFLVGMVQFFICIADEWAR
jgi:hypothetical protein